MREAPVSSFVGRGFDASGQPQMLSVASERLGESLCAGRGEIVGCVMAKYRVQKNPFKSSDYEDVEADGFMEEGSYTKFVGADGGVVLAIPTKLVTKIVELKE